MKTIYNANNRNINGDERVEVEQGKDSLGEAKFQVVLRSPIEKFILGFFNTKFEAIDFADDYIAIN